MNASGQHAGREERRLHGAALRRFFDLWRPRQVAWGRPVPRPAEAAEAELAEHAVDLVGEALERVKRARSG